MRLNKFLFIGCILFLSATVSNAFTFICPSQKQIKISPTQGGYTWVGPDMPDVVTGDSRPQQGTKVLGNATSAIADYMSELQYYDFVCFYPTNASSPDINWLPPNTGYVFYRYYNAPNTCTVQGTVIICKDL